MITSPLKEISFYKIILISKNLARNRSLCRFVIFPFSLLCDSSLHYFRFIFLLLRGDNSYFFYFVLAASRANFDRSQILLSFFQIARNDASQASIPWYFTLPIQKK